MKILVLLILIAYVPQALSLDNLEKGSVSYTSRDLSNEDFIRFTGVARNISNVGLKGADFRYFVEGEGYTYALMKDMKVVGYSNSATILAGSWLLSRWPNEYVEQEILDTYDYGDGRFSMPGDSKVYLADELKLLHLMGCLPKTPLRYGDVTGDGSAELVVFLSDDVSTDMRLLSPAKGKVIFSSKLHFFDSQNRQDVTGDYPHDAPYQYLSSRQIGLNRPAAPASLGFAKLYVNDFNDDQQPELLVWRKLYQSRRLDDDIKGFKHVRDTLLHYQLTNGEYQPQDTNEVTIKGWLAAKNLTWQKGYPSKSECPSEEGKLIPEMHDPLLNDPDVLK